MLPRSSRLLFTLPLSLVCAAQARVVFVRADAAGAVHDGATWATACTSVGDGLTRAASGDEVWVARGAYRETVTLNAGAGLYGGFAGTETAREQRDGRSNLAVIDAGGGGSAVTVPPGATLSTVIDGFTIRNGYCTVTADTHQWVGGGVCCLDASPTVSNNVIEDCGGQGVNLGGGIYLRNSNALIRGNTIRACYVENAGSAIACYAGAPIISGNRIDGNRQGDMNTSGLGGAIDCQFGSATISRNIIRGNRSRDAGGAINLRGQCAVSVLANVIAGNTCKSSSAAIACESNSVVRAVGNTIVGNTSLGASVTVNVNGSVFSNNVVAFNTGGVYVYRPSGSSSAVLKNNCVYGNGGSDWGGTDPTGSNGNIRSDPLLASLAYGNVHIQPGSPCRDAGDNASSNGISQDIDGQARVQGICVDIGADESNGAIWSSLPPVVRVSPSGSDSNDGSSWVAAKRTIAAALAALDPGGEVWAAAGTYNDRLRVRPFTYLYGGFAGDETERSTRRPSAHVTMIDPQPYGPAAKFIATGTFSALDGFSVRNGQPAPDEIINYVGVVCLGSSPRLTNNAFLGASSTTYGTGGLWCETLSSAVITGNTFAVDSGGVAMRDNSNAVFTGNRGTTVMVQDSSVLVANNVLTSISCTGSFDPTLTSKTVIRGNEVPYVHMQGCSPLIANNTMVGGGAGNGFGAGAISMFGGECSPIIVNNIVAFGGTGIGVYAGPTPVLRNNCVYGNSFGNYVGFAADPTGTNGNLSVDPLFRNRTLKDYRLSAGSPGIDAGDDSGVPPGTFDLNGIARPHGPHVDMGAYEWSAPYAMSDAVAALRLAAGLHSAGASGLPLDVEGSGGSGRVDLMDAARIARKATGLDPD